MTDLNLHLSTQLQTQLSQEGVWAYAVYFTGGKDPVWTKLVNNGAVQSGGETSITLPTSFVGGKVFFIIQSQAAGSPETLPTDITIQSELNWENATSKDFRFDSIEVTLQNGANDAGNLSSVEGFGLPMAMQVHYSNGTTGSVGYGITGNALVSDIDAIDPSETYSYTYTSGPLAGTFRMAASPTVAVGGSFPNPPFAQSDWVGYIDQLKGPVAENVLITGMFNGAPDANSVWHDAGYFAYELSWDAAKGTFWLSPKDSSVIKGFIKITPDALSKSIYSTLGDVEIYNSKSDTVPYLVMNTGLNNQWGKVLSTFLTGFTGGFYLNTAHSPNGQITTPLSLDWNGTWDPTFSFRANSASPTPTYMAYDAYSKIFYDHSNSYGSNYSDALMSQYTVGGPLLPMSEPSGAPNAGLNVPDIDLTIFADGETPSGYVVPVIYNYIAPPGGEYATATGPTPGINIGFNFNIAPEHSIGVVLDKHASITFSVLKSDTGGTPVWSTVTIDGATGGSNGLWQEWTIGFDAGTGQYTVTANDPPVPHPVGSMLINAIPVASDGVNWFQIGIGGKTFNLYATTDGGQFVNPPEAGTPGALAVDGLAKLQLPAVTTPTMNTFSVNFTGDAMPISPDLVVQNTSLASSLPAPAAPVVGTVLGPDFTALAGQTTMVGSVATSTSSILAFGWTGLNPNAYNPDPDKQNLNWTAKYTNKIGAGNIARVTIQPVSGDAIYATGMADLDGAWRTSPVVLANGSYTVTMLSYLATDTTFTTPLTSTSSTLTLTVNAAPCFALGTRIATARGHVPVENLIAGDLVQTASGQMAPVIWLGHRRVECHAHPRPHDVMPVRVRPGAFGPGMPAQDLVLSPDHAVFVDGVLVPVRYLLNGATVLQEDVAQVTYFHVELPRHDVLLAEGMPCESFLDTGNRGSFANGGQPIALHPDFALRVWESEACAPLVREGAALAEIRRRALWRAGALGFALTRLPELRVEADGVVLALEAHQGGWRVALPEGVEWVTLASRCAIPGHVRPEGTDGRRLGVALSHLWLDGQAVALDDARLAEGWHAAEPDWRWTDGAARLHVAGARELAFVVAMTEAYWHAPAVLKPAVKKPAARAA